MCRLVMSLLHLLRDADIIQSPAFSCLCHSGPPVRAKKGQAASTFDSPAALTNYLLSISKAFVFGRGLFFFSSLSLFL